MLYPNLSTGISTNSRGIPFQLPSGVHSLYRCLFGGLIYLVRVCEGHLHRAIPSVSHVISQRIRAALSELYSPSLSPSRIVRHQPLLSLSARPFHRCRSTYFTGQYANRNRQGRVCPPVVLLTRPHLCIHLCILRPAVDSVVAALASVVGCDVRG